MTYCTYRSRYSVMSKKDSDSTSRGPELEDVVWLNILASRAIHRIGLLRLLVMSKYYRCRKLR